MRFTDTYLRSNFPHRWTQIYDRREYTYIDPAVAHCVARTAPLVWSASSFTTSAQREMYEEARRHGLSTGITLPIHGRTHELGMLSFVSGCQTPQSLLSHAEHCLPMLTLLRDVAFDTGQRFLSTPSDTQIPTLTPRELECLKWTAQGKSTWEISKIFGCSEATVNFHMANIRGKFGVNSRIAAAVKAVRFGLITPD